MNRFLSILAGISTLLWSACGNAAPSRNDLVDAAVADSATPEDATSNTDLGTAPQCTWGDAPEGCEACLQTSCCGQTAACANDADCNACVRGTNTELCESDEETHSRVDAFLTCQSASCHSLCFGTSPTMCEGVFGGTCGDCLEANCCEAVSNCASYQACLDCAGGDHEACHAATDSHAAYHALSTCMTNHCSTQCN